MDDKDTSRTIRTGFTDRFVVSHAIWEVTERPVLTDEGQKRALGLAFAHIHFALR